MRSAVKKQLASWTLDKKEQSELTDRQKQLIEFMASKPHKFLGPMARGSQTPDDMISELLWDRYVLDWLESDLSIEKAKPYLENGIVDLADVKTLLEHEIDPEKLDQEVTKELFNKTGKSEKELVHIKEDFDGFSSITDSITLMYRNDYITIDDLIEMCSEN